jgi:hypothetical protein
MMRRASLAVSSPREPRRKGPGSGGMRVRLVLFEDTDIAFMIRLEVRDSQVEHSTIRHIGKPMLGEQTLDLIRFQRHRDASMLSQIPRPRSSPQIHPFLGSLSLSNGQAGSHSPHQLVSEIATG